MTVKKVYQAIDKRCVKKLFVGDETPVPNDWYSHMDDALRAGPPKKEAQEAPPKRGPGRPPKVETAE
jgi:hypothetical protein